MAGEYSFTNFLQDVSKCRNKSPNAIQALTDLDKSYRMNDTEKASRCAKTAVVSLLSDGLPEDAAKFLLGLCQQSAGQKDADVGIQEEQEMGGEQLKITNGFERKMNEIISEHNALRTQNDALKTQLADLRRTNGEQEQLVNKLFDTNDKLEKKTMDLKAENEAMLKHIKKSEKKMAEVETQLSDKLREKHRELEDAKRELDTLKTRLPQQAADTREADYFLGLLDQLEKYTDQAPGLNWPDSGSVKQSGKLKDGWEYAVRIKTKIGKALEEQQKITNGFERNLNETISENDALTTKIADLKRQVADLRQTNGTQEQLLNKLFHTNDKLEKKTMDLKAENEAMLKHIKKSEKKMAEVETQHSDRLRDKDRELEDAKRELDTLKTRFSKMAGDRMTGGNSNIPELSDPDRQMKLGDKYGNTYDDEWTDAFMDMTESLGSPQKDAIDFLLFVLKDSFEHCKKVSSEHFTALRTLLLYPDQSCAAQGGDMEMRPQSKNQNDLLALRSQISANSGKVIPQQFVSVLKKKLTDGKENPDIVDKFLPYVNKCVEICWQLVLHNPPMHISFELDHGAKFDNLLFNRYGQKGDKYDFLVWPPLFVSVNGGLVSKGTAQPIPGGKKLPKKK